jgi:phage terminase large subunit-like protein
MWDTSCRDWRERLLAGKSLVPDLPLFKDEAALALRVFSRMHIPDVIGLPTNGEAAGPWLFPIVEAIFGSYDPETNRRMISEFFVLVPKKNGKTSTSAAIMVVALILNRRPRGEFVLVAPTKEIADISFKQARDTILADEELKKLFHMADHRRTITHRRTGATLAVKAADTDVITGGKQVGTLIDELHVLGAKKNAAQVMIELRGALAARPDGFLITITTQSKEPPQGVFKSELAKARAVRDGKMNLPLLPILYELPHDIAKDGGWKNKGLWPFINPNLGRSVDLPFLEREVDVAETQGKEQLALIASQHFNVEVGLSLQMDRWRGADYWEGAAEDGLSLQDIIERCDCVTCGVDGGGNDDLYGFCVIGRERGSEDIRQRRWLVWNHTWVSTVGVQARKSENAKYSDFQKAGELTIVENLDDAEIEIADIVTRLEREGLLPEQAIGIDPVGCKSLTDKLECVGIGIDRLAAVQQGYRLNGTIIDVERRLYSKTLAHGGQAIMAWAVGNAKVEVKGNALLITKQASGRAKIDPLMALLDAATLMGNHPTAGGRSFWDIDEEVPA